MDKNKVSELECWLRRAWIFDRLGCPTLASICRELAKDCAREGWSAFNGWGHYPEIAVMVYIPVPAPA